MATVILGGAGRFRYFCLAGLVSLATLGAAGCSTSAPTDPVTEEQQLKELNEHRQREMTNS